MKDYVEKTIVVNINNFLSFLVQKVVFMGKGSSKYKNLWRKICRLKTNYLQALVS